MQSTRAEGWLVRIARIFYIVFAATVIHGIWFFQWSDSIGGTAWNGYVESGKYFVGSHGKYREVPQETWQRSVRHNRIVVASSGTCLILGVVLGVCVITCGGRQGAGAADAPGEG